MSAVGVHLNPEISTWSFLAAHVTATLLNARAFGIGIGIRRYFILRLFTFFFFRKLKSLTRSEKIFSAFVNLLNLFNTIK